METTGTREEETTMLCRILAMPVKHWFLILANVLIFMALCVVVFAGETGAPRCNLQSGLAGVLNLSQQQCEDIQRVTDRFYDDTAGTRNKIVEKRFDLRSLSKTIETDLPTLNKKKRELKTLEQEFFRKAHETEVAQGRLLTPEQTNKMKSIPAGYDFRRFVR
jgi:Spy/CpxP family protein refolding chaperone